MGNLGGENGKILVFGFDWSTTSTLLISILLDLDCGNGAKQRSGDVEKIKKVFT